jgi:hypothetical protein
MPNDETVQTAIRIPAAWVPRLHEIAGRISRPGIPITQADAMRAAIAEGLGVLEAQLGIAQTPTAIETPEPKPKRSKGRR